MEINPSNIPKAIIYLVGGIFVNIVLFYVLSPDYGDVFGILTGIFDMSADAKTIIWGGIAIAAILINLGYPLWCLFDTEEGYG